MSGRPEETRARRPMPRLDGGPNVFQHLANDYRDVHGLLSECECTAPQARRIQQIIQHACHMHGIS